MRFNESGGAPLSPTDFCSWEAQKGMFAIRLRVRVVKWLGSHLIESRQSSATPGELGGILLGQAHLDAGKQILLIEGFVPVPCNYGENFSDKDKWIADFGLRISNFREFSLAVQPSGGSGQAKA